MLSDVCHQMNLLKKMDDKEDIIDKLHDVKIQPTIQDTEKHTRAIDQ